MRDPYTAIDWIFQIERYVGRIEETRGPRRGILLPEEIEDIVKLNILHAIEAAIDLARHIHLDQRFEHLAQRYPELRDYRHLYFGVLAEKGVIKATTAEILANLVRWFYIAINEYWHVIVPDPDGSELNEWLAALRALIVAVTERFSLVCPDGWGDSGGRDHFSGENSVVPIVASGDREDGEDVQIQR